MGTAGSTEEMCRAQGVQGSSGLRARSWDAQLLLQIPLVRAAFLENPWAQVITLGWGRSAWRGEGSREILEPFPVLKGAPTELERGFG